MMRVLTRQPFTVVFAVLVGLVAAPLLSIGMQALGELYDAVFPVVRMRGDLVRSDRQDVLIRVHGTKHRKCTYLRLQALTRDGDGVMRDANIERTDMIENGDTKEPGDYFFGEWRIWPRGAATVILINSNHLCGTRLVVTRIAEVPI